MRRSFARFACLAAALLAAPACNAIFGITQGAPESTAGGGSAGAASSSGHGGGHGGAGTASSSGQGGGQGGASASTASAGGAAASSGTGGGATCSEKGKATCANGVITVCDDTGHTPGPVDCGAAALCDPIAQKCSDFGRLSIGSIRACAIDDVHAVHCWGYNGGSPLGGGGSLFLGDTHLMFVQAEPVSGVSAYQISVADDHQCALQQSGDVACWGSDAHGVLGTAPQGTTSLNTQVMGLSPYAVEVGTAHGCSCARLSDGSVWCWGDEEYGCLGTASSVVADQPTPAKIALGAPAVQIRIGDGYETPSCARLANGQVVCWGVDFTPTAVPNLTDASDLAVGDGFVLIQRASGVSWTLPVLSPPDGGAPDGGGGGSGGSGGGGTWSLPPATPYVGAGKVTQMGAGNSFCAVLASGAVECAPLYNPVPTPPPPAQVPAIPTGTIAEIAVGYGNFYDSTVECVRLAGLPFAESIYCWGDDSFGDLGVGGPEYFTMAQDVTSLTAAASALFTGEDSTNVVIASDGSARFWGSGHTFIGNGTTFPLPSAPLAELGVGNTRVTTEDELGFGYALKTSGASPLLFDQGGPLSGPPQRLLANAFTNFTSAWYGYTDVGLLPPSASGNVVLFTTHADGNTCGIFGDGTTSLAATGQPVLVPGLNAKALAYWGQDYSACDSVLCAIEASGALWCWGSNGSGQAGHDTTPLIDPITTPMPVVFPASVTMPIVSVALGSDFSCATDGAAGSGQVYCWGRNDYGQLGSQSPPDYEYFTAAPTPVLGINNGAGTVPAVGVTASLDHACAWLSDGTVSCWGSNDFGQLGNGTFDTQSLPVAVTGLTTVMQVSAGPTHTCALHTGGAVSCWGSSYYGQVGTGQAGTEPATPLPRLVKNLP
jgi:alpha-tubulin suppressor-like RCC1 family protein